MLISRVYNRLVGNCLLTSLRWTCQAFDFSCDAYHNGLILIIGNMAALILLIDSSELTYMFGFVEQNRANKIRMQMELG